MEERPERVAHQARCRGGERPQRVAGEGGSRHGRGEAARKEHREAREATTPPHDRPPGGKRHAQEEGEGEGRGRGAGASDGSHEGEAHEGGPEGRPERRGRAARERGDGNELRCCPGERGEDEPRRRKHGKRGQAARDRAGEPGHANKEGREVVVSGGVQRAIVLLGLLHELPERLGPVARVPEIGQELVREVAHVRGAVRRVGGDGLAEGEGGLAGELGAVLPEGPRRAALNHLERSGRGVRSEGTLPREGLPHHHGEGEYVGALVHEHPLDLLRRHVADGPAPRAAVARGGGERGHAKVRELNHAAAVDHDIGGLDVEVEDEVLVRVRQGLGDGVQDVGALLGREASPLHAGEELREVESVDILHHEVGVGPVGLEVVDGDDVGVGEHAGGARLGKGLLGRGGGRGVHDGHALYRNAPLKAQVPAGADGAEPPGAPPLEDAVPPKEDLVAGSAPLLVRRARARRWWR